MKKISVIIPSYNSSQTIKECVLSVIKTEYPSLEIIIVDDVSTDNTPQIVEMLRCEYPGIVRLVRHETNGGPAKARNTGAKCATGEYLFFLDSDTVMLPDALQNFSNQIESTDAVTGIYYFEPLNYGFAQQYKAMLNYYFFSRRGVVKYEVFDASRAGIKAKVFHELGGFNENLKWGMDYENEEFGYRLCKRYTNLLDPSIAVKHRFPGMKKSTKVYFFRVALWMEIFLVRKKFESGGVTTPETGICTIGLLFAIITFPVIMIHQYLGFVPLFFLATYLYGYKGFLWFVFRKKPIFLPVVFFLNVYFTVVLGIAAFFGIFKVVTGRSNIKGSILA